MGRVLKKSDGLRRVRTSRGTLAAVGVVLCLGVSAATAQQIKKSFPTTATPSLLLHSYNGNIRVKGWERNEMEILGERSSSAMEVVIAEGAEKVTVETRPLHPNVSGEQSRVDFKIQVPGKATIRVDSHQGEITVEGVHGDVAIEGVSNSVFLSLIQGHVSVRTVEGPILLRDSEGHVELYSISGDLKLVRVNGPQMVASTNSGSIHYEGDFGSGGTYVFKNYSSPIEILTSSKASFDLTARAVQGLIESNLAFRPIPMGSSFQRLPPGKFLQGRLNTGKSTVQVTSFSGTIRLQGPGPQ